MKKRSVLLIALITLSLLAGLEISCRLFNVSRFVNSDFRFYIRQVDNDLRCDFVMEDPLLMWSLKPGYQNAFLSINSHGFRDKKYDEKKAKKVFRILCLGDSSTLGYQVPLEDTYHALLEERLNLEQSHSGRRFEVINAGIVGYTSVQGLYLYLFRGVDFEPDLVTFYFGINETIRRFYLNDAEILNSGRPQWLNILVNKWLLKSELVRIIQQAGANLLRKTDNGDQPLAARVPPADYRQTIIQLHEECKRRGAKLLLISPALLVKTPSSDDTEIMHYRRLLEQTARETGLPLLTIPEMTEYDSVHSSDLFLPGDPGHPTVHPSPAGHRLIMQRLYDFIIANNLLRPLSPP